MKHWSEWPWSSFRGSAECLKWSKRDLENLDRAIDLTTHRRVAVQAGGNLGLFAKWMAACFRAVYTFEPDPGLFQVLCHNAPELNILKFEAALGCERKLVGTVRGRRDGKPNVHEGTTYVAGEGNVPTLQVDDLGLHHCDLLYLDVEGYELFALKGATHTLSRCRPNVVVEINKGITYNGLTGDDVRRYLKLHSYVHKLSVNSDELYIPAERA